MPGVLDPKTVKYVFTPDQIRELIAADLESSPQFVIVNFVVVNKELHSIEVTHLK